MVAAKPHLSLILQVAWSDTPPHSDLSTVGYALLCPQRDANSFAWLLNSWAIGHMTFDAMHFSATSPPRHTSVANANGIISPVTGASSVNLSSSLHLSNTLLVLSLSNKLLSICQITADLGCVVLIYPTSYLLQDILTKKIIGRGTKREDYIMWTTLVQDRHIKCTI